MERPRETDSIFNQFHQAGHLCNSHLWSSRHCPAALSCHWRLHNGSRTHGVLEGLKKQLVGQQVHCQLLVAKAVHAVCRSTRRCAHLRPYKSQTSHTKTSQKDQR